MGGNTLINIKALNKADVLAALYNSAKPQGMGFLQYDPTPMTREQAQTLLKSGQPIFDYLKGRVMKINLSNDEIDPRLYDRDNGPGTAEQAIVSLKNTKKVNSKEIRDTHYSNTRAEARSLKGKLNQESTCKRSEDGLVVQVHLGYAHVADILNSKMDEGLKKLNLRS